MKDDLDIEETVSVISGFKVPLKDFLWGIKDCREMYGCSVDIKKGSFGCQICDRRTKTKEEHIIINNDIKRWIKEARKSWKNMRKSV